jgi:hypothetical protein
LPLRRVRQQQNSRKNKNANQHVDPTASVK